MNQQQLSKIHKVETWQLIKADYREKHNVLKYINKGYFKYMSLTVNSTLRMLFVNLPWWGDEIGLGLQQLIN